MEGAAPDGTSHGSSCSGKTRRRVFHAQALGAAGTRPHHADEIDRLLARHQPLAGKRQAKTEDNESLGGLSARNRLFGYIEEVRVDGLLAQVQLRVGDQRLTAVITADAVRGLKLRRGDDAIAVVKSTEVMIALPPARLRPTKTKAT